MGISLVFGDAQTLLAGGFASYDASIPLPFAMKNECQEVLRDADLSGPLMICLTLGQNA